MKRPLEEALFSDAENDFERALIIRRRGYETGIVCEAIKEDVAKAFDDRWKMAEEIARLQAELKALE